MLPLVFTRFRCCDLLEMTLAAAAAAAAAGMVALAVGLVVTAMIAVAGAMEVRRA
jgi:hypothetical protein